MTINDADFSRLVRFVRERYGINLEHKRQLIDARLAFDISRRGYRDFTSYVSEVVTDPNGEECRHMVNRLSTNYTFFFREPDSIEKLCGPVLADFCSHGRERIRIWSAACSSGQEAYSIAMALTLLQRATGQPFSFEIVGTDINTETLATAERGVYPEEELAQIPARYRQFTLRRAGGVFEVAPEIRARVSWRYENLLSDDAPAGYDVIFCRNVMIYFTPALRRDMTKRLYAALRPGGYLFTGATESIDLERKRFRYLSPAFYQRAEARDKEGT